MSWMEVKIHLHHQQISKSTVRTLSKMQAATSAQELSIRIVNRPIRNITNNGNQTITTNNGNNDNNSNSNNSNDNDIPDKIESQEKFTGIW